jgi:hypothetical protein
MDLHPALHHSRSRLSSLFTGSENDQSDMENFKCAPRIASIEPPAKGMRHRVSVCRGLKENRFGVGF